MNIRKAAPFRFAAMRKSDVETVATMDAAVFGADTWALKDFFEAFEDPDYRWILLKDAKKVVGYCLVSIDDGVMGIDSILIDPALQGLGLGKLLLMKTINQAIRLKCTAIVLEVHENNARAQKMYLNHGFAHVSTSDEPYYADGGKSWNFNLDVKTVDASAFRHKRVREMLLSINSASETLSF